MLVSGPKAIVFSMHPVFHTGVLYAMSVRKKIAELLPLGKVTLQGYFDSVRIGYLQHDG